MADEVRQQEDAEGQEKRLHQPGEEARCWHGRMSCPFAGLRRPTHTVMGRWGRPSFRRASVRSSSDAGVKTVVVGSVTSSTYCVSSLVGSKKWYKNGPGNDIDNTAPAPC